MKSLVLLFAFAGLSCAEAQTQGQDRREARRGGEEVNQQVAQACKTEMQQLCQGQKGQQAEQCLRNNQSKLGSQCKGAISGAPGAPKSPQN